MGFLSEQRKKRAINEYIRELPQRLAQDYGKWDQYTPEQVRQTIERHHLNTRYRPWAMALFSEKAEYLRYQQETGEPGHYDTMREEIAARYFEGRCDFETVEVERLSASPTFVGLMGGALGAGGGLGGAGDAGGGAGGPGGGCEGGGGCGDG